MKSTKIQASETRTTKQRRSTTYKSHKRIWVNLALSDDVVRRILKATQYDDLTLYQYVDTAILCQLKRDEAKSEEECTMNSAKAEFTGWDNYK